MYSIGILSTVLFALLATTNALECRPVMCMIACPFGFDVDAQGCPFCSCRRPPNTCFEPIFGYNCGAIDHRDCPSTHECQLSLGGLTGQCCLKPSGSTTARPATGTSTARPATGTSTARPATGFSTARPATTTGTARATTATPTSSTRRSMNRLFTFASGSTTQAPRTSSPVPTTPSSATSSRYTRPARSTQHWLTLVQAKHMDGSDQ